MTNEEFQGNSFYIFSFQSNILILVFFLIIFTSVSMRVTKIKIANVCILLACILFYLPWECKFSSVYVAMHYIVGRWNAIVFPSGLMEIIVKLVQTFYWKCLCVKLFFLYFKDLFFLIFTYVCISIVHMYLQVTTEHIRWYHITRSCGYKCFCAQFPCKRSKCSYLFLQTLSFLPLE